MQIQDLPPELQELVHLRQKEQGNNGFFKGALNNASTDNNFEWRRTPEGHEFWSDINQGRIDKEHPFYPKTNYELY